MAVCTARPTDAVGPAPINRSGASKLSVGRPEEVCLATRSVTLKLKDASFQLRTRTRLPATQLAGRLFEAAEPMLREACDGVAFWLIGIGGSDLCDGAQADRGDLADTGIRREAEREAAIDRLREKF